MGLVYLLKNLMMYHTLKIDEQNFIDTFFGIGETDQYTNRVVDVSNNLKVIRKNLNHTQTSLAKALDIGFRSYVRYEAGERDAPVSVLIKIAYLGNISLEQLLKTGIKPNDIAPLKKLCKDSKPVKIESVRGRPVSPKLTSAEPNKIEPKMNVIPAEPQKEPPTIIIPELPNIDNGFFIRIINKI